MSSDYFFFFTHSQYLHCTKLLCFSLSPASTLYYISPKMVESKKRKKRVSKDFFPPLITAFFFFAFPRPSPSSSHLNMCMCTSCKYVYNVKRQCIVFVTQGTWERQSICNKLYRTCLCSFIIIIIITILFFL